MATAEVVSAAAAVVSAIWGAFATWAAFRSADSARASQRAVEESERKTALREVAVTAAEIKVEEQRAAARGAEVALASRALEAFSGSYGNSSTQLMVSAVNEKLAAAKERRPRRPPSVLSAH